MKTLKLKPHLTVKEIQLNLKQTDNTIEFKRWQCLYLIQTIENITAEYLSKFLCISKPYVYKIVQTYNKHGKESVVPKEKGGRKRSLLSWSEELKLMDRFTEDAIQGKLITANHIREITEKKIGRKVSDDYLWDLFHRHGWKKKKPRPSHPKSNKQKQDDFKKNLRMIWAPFE